MKMKKRKINELETLTATEQIDLKRQEDLQRLRGFCLLDDDFMTKFFERDTPIGKLLHDFSCTEADDMHYGILADRVRFFKESKEGIEIMCRAMEEMVKQRLKEVALRMLKAGKYTLEEIANILELPFEEVKQLQIDINI
ncbi:MAG: hypothetical protein K2H31_04535 [Lachnospiraceae bacterium]|nr:hypothetical protein [Lachnospiraceae bacterium]